MLGPKLCRTCETLGIHRPATRILPSGGGRCEEHYRKEAGLPPLKSNSGKEISSYGGPSAHPPAAAAAERENTMKDGDGRASKLDHEAMQRDRDAGIRVVEIAKKYKCHAASVYLYTKGTGKGILHAAPRKTLAEKAAAALSTDGRHVNRGRPRKAVPSTPGGRSDDDILNELRARRAALTAQAARLDRAIAALEEIG